MPKPAAKSVVQVDRRNPDAEGESQERDRCAQQRAGIGYHRGYQKKEPGQQTPHNQQLKQQPPPGP